MTYFTLILSLMPLIQTGLTLTNQMLYQIQSAANLRKIKRNSRCLRINTFQTDVISFFNMIQFISGLDYVVRLRRLSSLKLYRYYRLFEAASREFMGIGLFLKYINNLH